MVGICDGVLLPHSTAPTGRTFARGWARAAPPWPAAWVNKAKIEASLSYLTNMKAIVRGTTADKA
jgi:hypothetical protein